MAETQTPAAPAAPAPAAEPAKPSPSEAGRTLRELRDSRRTAASSAPASSSTDTSPSVRADASKSGSPTSPQSEPSTDEALKLIREQRAVAEARKAVEAERAKLKELDPDLATVRAVREAREKKDVVALVKALGFTEQDLYEGDKSLFWQLAELAKTGEAKGEPAVDIPKLVSDELKKHDEERAAAETKQQEAARQQAAERLQAHSRSVNEAVLTELTRDLAKYPSIKEYGGIPDRDVSNPEYVGAANVRALVGADQRLTERGSAYLDQWGARFQRERGRAPNTSEARAHLNAITSPGFADWFEEQHGRMPRPGEVLQHFEGAYRAQVERQAAALGLMPARPAPAPNGAWRGDVGSPPPVERPESLDDIRNRRRAALERR